MPVFPKGGFRSGEAPPSRAATKKRQDAVSPTPCSRVERKELAMTRSRLANAEALVRHVSTRIQTENRSVLDRTGLSADLLRVPRDSPMIVTCGSTRSGLRSRESPSNTKGGTQSYLPSSTTTSTTKQGGKPVVIFGSEPDPGEAGVVDPTPNESYEVVSAYLQQIVRDLLEQMTGPSSAKHYDRHVLLVDEMLRKEAIYGFTPSMVLAGVGDIMCLFSQALLEGKFLVPPHPTHGYSKAKAHRAAIAAAASVAAMPPSTSPHEAAAADRVGLAVPKVGIESYLPSHVKKPIQLDSCGPDRALSDALPEYNTRAPNTRSPSSDDRHPLEHIILSDADVSPGALRQRSPDSKIVTVQDALYAMIQHCSRPLVCVTLEDQRSLVPAVELLCSVLSRISSEVVSDVGETSTSQEDSSVSLTTPRPIGQVSSLATTTATDRTAATTQHEHQTPKDTHQINTSASSILSERTPGRNLGGLSLEDHQTMTRAIRLSALHAIEAVLSVYDRHIDTIELTKEKERPTAEGTSTKGKRKGVDRMHTDTVTTAILNGLDLSRSEISELLVERWASILQNAPPVEDRNGNGCGGQAPLLDSARNVNPFTAKDAFLNDGVDSDVEEDEEDAVAIAQARNASHRGKRDDTRGSSHAEEESAFTASNERQEDANDRHERTSSPATFKKDDSRFRGVLTMAEEEEVAAVLHIFIQLFSLSEYAMKSMHSHISSKTPMGSKTDVMNAHFDVPLHPLIPILVARTLARCAVGDYCSSLCLDLLWQLILSAPHMTSKSILYDLPQCPHGKEPTNSLYETSATENLFQALINFLNNSHRQQQREMRNDLVIILTSILRTNAKAMDTVPLDSSTPQSQLQLPIPMSTIDAISAISLVLFDLLCRPELTSGTVATMSSATAQATRNSCDGLVTPNSPCLSFVSRQTLLTYAINFHGPMCPTLRVDNLQFKRVGWQFLESFCEWQAVHMSYEGKVVDLMIRENQRVRSLDPSNVMTASTPKQDKPCSLYVELNNDLSAASASSPQNLSLDQSEELLQLRRQTYDSYMLVDLCQLGFMDVLLMYCNIHCESRVVLEWAQGELYSLQEESWRLLSALVQSSENCRKHYGITSMRQEDIDEVRSRLASSPGTGNSTSSAVRLNGSKNYTGGQQQNSNNSNNTSSPKTSSQEGGRGASQSENNNNNSRKEEEGASALMQQQYYPADVYFIALEGVDTCLRYVTQAPQSVEQLKYLVITVLAAVSRSSDCAVKKSLAYASPDLVPLLTQLVGTLLNQVQSGFGTVYKHQSKRDAAGYGTRLEEVACSTIPPSIKVQTLVLACFSLLQNIGTAAQELIAEAARQTSNVLVLNEYNHSQSSGSTTAVNSPQTAPQKGFDVNVGHEMKKSHRGPESVSSGTSSEMRGLTPEIPSASWYFQQCGGIHQIVEWVRYVLYPNKAKEQSIISTAMSKNPSSLKPRRPPLLEKDLHDQLDLLIVLMSCVRAFVLGVDSNMQSLLEEQGMAALLDIIEALSIASDALPSERTKDLNCIIRDRSIAVSLPSGFYNKTIEAVRKDDFHNALEYALVVLSDLIVSCRPAVSYYLGWHCHFLPKSHEVGFGAPPHLHEHDNYLNATQLLLALWIKATDKRTPDDPFFFDAKSFDNEDKLVIGARVLNTNIRNTTEVSLRREYARRLLRRRVADRLKAGADKSGNASSVTSAISIPELVNYYHYIFDYQASNLSEEEISMRMMELVNTDDASSRQIHHRLITDSICQPFGIAVKVFSCLAAIGFDDLADVPVSPAERAHLIGVAALPALCTDELVVSMAEVARANENLPWGEKNVKSNSHSYIQEKTINMDQVVEMRPTTPDRRCLNTLMDDVQSRSHELSQLFDLGKATEATQLRELYNRFLITRLRQPVGVASLWEEFNNRNGTCEVCAFDQIDKAEKEQMSRAPATMNTPELMSECSSAALSHVSRAISSPFPSQLAASVSKKVERDQEESTLLTIQRSYPGEVYSPNQGGHLRVLSPPTESGVQQELPLTSTPSTMTRNIAVYHNLDGTSTAPAQPCAVHASGATEGNQENLICTCASSAPKPVPPLLDAASPLGTGTTTTVSKPVDLTMSWPTRPKSSLAEKHLRKDRMIKNSLRGVGGVTKTHKVPPAQETGKQSPAASHSPSRALTPDKQGVPELDIPVVEVTSRERAEVLVDKVIAYVDYAEPEPAYIFPLNPKDSSSSDDNSFSF